jgi:membrane-associated protease RseP (regulator of RpoE activity)
MPIALKFIAAIALLTAVHVGAMTMLGHWLRIAVREVSLGFGPVLLSAGIFRLRALPLGGFVLFKDTRAEAIPADAPPGWVKDAFDHQQRWVQALLPLAGASSLVAMAFVWHPGSALASVGHGFVQIVAGGLGPLSTAQQLIGGANHIATLGFVPLLGVLAAKFAALNLLPLTAMNGGQALLALLDPAPREMPRWKQMLTQWSVWLLIALTFSWAVAIGFFAFAR